MDSAFLLNFRCLPSPYFTLVSPELRIHMEVRMAANVLLCVARPGANASPSPWTGERPESRSSLAERWGAARMGRFLPCPQPV